MLFGLNLTIAASQENTCNRIKDGQFRLVDNSTGVTLISRKGKFQLEEGVNDKVKIVAEVIWIDECTYELRNPRVLSGKPDYPVPSDLVVTTRVISVQFKKYRVQVTTNMCAIVLEKEIEIL